MVAETSRARLTEWNGAHIVPEFAVIGAGALPRPGCVGEVLDQHSLVSVAGLVGLVEAGEELAEFVGKLVGEQKAVGIWHVGLLPPSELSRGGGRPRNSVL